MTLQVSPIYLNEITAPTLYGHCERSEAISADEGVRGNKALPQNPTEIATALRASQ